MAASSAAVTELRAGAALVEAARDFDGVSEEQILETVKAYRKERAKPGLTVVAEAAKATA